MARMDKLELNGVKYISEDYLIEKMVEQALVDGGNDTLASVYEDESDTVHTFENLLKYTFEDDELLKKFQKLYVLKRFIERGMGS